MAAVGGMTVGAVALASTVGGGATAHTVIGAPSTSSSGRILALTAAGQLELSPVDGAGSKILTDLGTFTQSGRDTTSPDGTLVLLGDGTLLSVHGGRVAVASRVRLARGLAVSFVSPLADHEQAIVAEQIVNNGPGDVFGVPVAGGPAVRLGPGIGLIAGDPQELGAFVALPLAGSALNQAVSDLPLTSAVALEEAGKPRRVLVTSAQANVDLHQSPSVAVSMIPYPDPQGGKVAIAVIPSNPDAIGGIVVVDRSGRLLDWTAEFTGTYGLSPSWSPNGTELAFTDQAPAGWELNLWTPNSVAGQQVVDNTTTQLFPDSPSGAGTCFWSPDGARVMCPTFTQSGAAWESNQVGSTGIEISPAPGTAIGWVGS